jgi:hypothetical protein
LEVEWSKGANELIGAYVARIYLVGSGTLPNYESSVSPAVFSGLDPNREYVVQIRSQNAVGDYSVSATTQTYTLPAVPGAPQATTILSNFQLGISFENQTQNPATTEYAVRLVAKAGFSGTPDASAGKYALLPGAGGTTTFSSDDPVWGRRSEWLGGSKLILTRLPDTFGYEVVLSARNDLKEEVGPGVGMAIAQSAGVPTVKMTLPTGEDLTQLDSLNKAIYYNGMTVPFTAVGSSHFNVLWSSRTRTIENNDMDQTYGWNGLLDVREDVVQADEDKFSKNDKAVGGFAVREEGEYFLNIAGTAMVDTGSGNLDVHDVFESTSPFRVYIDTTPPVAGALEVYFSSEAARDRNQEQRISTGTLWGDPNPYVTWDPRDLLGKEISRSPVEGWTVSVSTDEPVLPSVDRTELTKEVGFEVDLTGVKDSRIYYIKVRGYDRAGNWTADGDVPVFEYQYTPDQIAPRWSLNHIVMTGIRYPAIDKTIRFAAVAAANNFVDIGFEEEMLIPGDSIQLMMERDSDGVKVDKPSALTLPTTSYVMVTEESKTMVVLPFNATDLKPASLYRFYSSTKPVPTDRANNPLQTPLDILFYTAMDPAQKAVFVSEDGNVTVSVSAGSLGNEPVGVAINDAPEKVSVAGSASLPVLVGKATESIGQQTGGAFKKIFSIKELSVFDTKGKMRSAAYGGDVRLSFDITKEAKVENGTSYMKGTSIRTKDLAIYELDQRTGVWNKMPDSQVDEMTGTVSVPLRHNGTYAMGGSPNYDLSSAHAYPVPYRAQREQNGISFTGLSSFGTIKIYTLDGRLVKTLSYDGVSSADWNPVNSDGGDPVGSDVYLYVIENDQQRKVGKLMVIR